MQTDPARSAAQGRRTLTVEEARLAGYSGYAQHLPSVRCPRDEDEGVYCADCQGALADLRLSVYGVPAKRKEQQ